MRFRLKHVLAKDEKRILNKTSFSEKKRPKTCFTKHVFAKRILAKTHFVKRKMRNAIFYFRKHVLSFPTK